MHCFTSITSNYIPKARVLAESIKRSHPEARFHLILSDRRPDGGPISPELFDSVVTVDELPIPDLQGWIFQHTVVELCTAVKGVFMREIVRRHGAEKVFYFDPDIVVLSPVDRLLHELDTHSILLTPHQTVPETSLEAVRDNEICSLKHGVYNLGFLGVRPTPKGRGSSTGGPRGCCTSASTPSPTASSPTSAWVDLPRPSSTYESSATRSSTWRPGT